MKIDAFFVDFILQKVKEIGSIRLGTSPFLLKFLFFFMQGIVVVEQKQKYILVKEISRGI